MRCNHFSSNQTLFHLYWGGAEAAGHAVWQRTKSQTTALSQHVIRINAANCWACFWLSMGRRDPPASLTQSLTCFGYVWSPLWHSADVFWILCLCVCVWCVFQGAVALQCEGGDFKTCREDKVLSNRLHKSENATCDVYQTPALKNRPSATNNGFIYLIELKITNKPGLCGSCLLSYGNTFRQHL